MFLKRIYKIIFIINALFLSLFGTVFAIDDGFGAAKKIEGKYFTIYYSPQVNVSGLPQQLNVSPSDKILVGGSANTMNLADMLDTLYILVGDALDMHIYSFKGNIKICPSHQQLDSIYNNLFGKSLTSSAYSFYVYDLNTIYASAENFKIGVVGHEMAHAIICRYFVVPPPIKVQEVLAMYVEYQLKRAGQGN